MEKKPAKGRYKAVDGGLDAAQNGQAVPFLLNSINATIVASADDYVGALEDFFPQVQALGHLIGAENLDEVSIFLRHGRHW